MMRAAFAGAVVAGAWPAVELLGTALHYALSYIPTCLPVAVWSACALLCVWCGVLHTWRGIYMYGRVVMVEISATLALCSSVIGVVPAAACYIVGHWAEHTDSRASDLTRDAACVCRRALAWGLGLLLVRLHQELVRMWVNLGLHLEYMKTAEPCAPMCFVCARILPHQCLWMKPHLARAVLRR